MLKIWTCCALFVAAWAWLFVGEAFHPTDYEFMMAAAWRIAHGQVPYRDFIYHRPPLSLYMHTAWLALPLELQVRASRVFLVLQFAFASFGPMLWAAKRGLVRAGWRAGGFALAAAALAAHTFPLMPWYTTDGVMFCTAGMVCYLEAGYVRHEQSWRWVALGSAAMYAAVMCKQSFLPAEVAFCLMAAARYRRPLSVVLPPAFGFLLLLAWLHATGAGEAFTAQMNSQSSAGALSDALLNAQLTIGGAVLAAAAFVWAATAHKYGGQVGELWVLVLATGVSSAISIGYATPALGMAGLCVPAAVLMQALDGELPFRTSWLQAGVAALVFAAVTAVRVDSPYRDAAAEQRVVDLRVVSPRLEGIRTNAGTAAHYLDLAEMVRYHVAKGFVVTQDYPGAHWLFGRPPDWSIDWAWRDDIRGHERQLWQDMQRGGLVALVPKEGSAPFSIVTEPPDCAHVDWAHHTALSLQVVADWELRDESPYFCLFAPRGAPKAASAAPRAPPWRPEIL